MSAPATQRMKSIPYRWLSEGARPVETPGTRGAGGFSCRLVVRL